MSDEEPPQSEIIDLETNRPMKFVTIEAFGRRFEDTLPGLAEDLVTLENDGVIYSRFFHTPTETFRDYRVRLLPREIVEYVDGAVGHQEFNRAMAEGESFERALAAISYPPVRELVRTYPLARIERDDRLVEVDIRGCQASFWPRELEALLCGNRPDRYESLPDLGDGRSRLAIVKAVCSAFPTVARYLRDRGRGRPPIAVESEYDVQDLLFAGLRPIFPDLRSEDWTPQVAGRARRIDLVFPELELVLEVKIIRDARHGRMVIDELMVDFETYHEHPSCGRLIAFVYDPEHHISDPELITRELSGLRVKQGHSFDVEVLIAS